MNLCDYCDGAVDNRTARKGKRGADGRWFHDGCDVLNRATFARLNATLADRMRRLGRVAGNLSASK